MTSIDRNSSFPLHEQVRNMLTSEIEAGTFGDSGRLPSETELCDRFGVSRISVRRAISDMVEGGLVTRRQGRGTFATTRPEFSATMSVVGLADRIAGEGEATRQIKVARTEEAGPRTAAALRISAGDLAHHLIRVFSLDDIPVSVDDTWYPAGRYPGLLDQIADDTSTYQVLRRRYDVHLTAVHRQFGVSFTTEETAGWLNRPVRDPLVLIEKIATDDQDQVVHTSRVEAVPGRLQIQMTARSD